MASEENANKEYNQLEKYSVDIARIMIKYNIKNSNDIEQFRTRGLYIKNVIKADCSYTLILHDSNATLNKGAFQNESNQIEEFLRAYNSKHSRNFNVTYSAGGVAN